jgi:hypothetical protein
LPRSCSEQLGLLLGLPLLLRLLLMRLLLMRLLLRLLRLRLLRLRLLLMRLLLRLLLGLLPVVRCHWYPILQRWRWLATRSALHRIPGGRGPFGGAASDPSLDGRPMIGNAARGGKTNFYLASRAAVTLVEIVELVFVVTVRPHRRLGFAHRPAGGPVVGALSPLPFFAATARVVHGHCQQRHRREDPECDSHDKAGGHGTVGGRRRRRRRVVAVGGTCGRVPAGPIEGRQYVVVQVLERGNVVVVELAWNSRQSRTPLFRSTDHVMSDDDTLLIIPNDSIDVDDDDEGSSGSGTHV